MIDLNETPTSNGTIDLDTSGSGVTPVTPELADAKSKQYDYALGDMSPGKDQIFQEMLNGEEDRFRKRMIGLEAVRRDQARQGTLLNFMKARNQAQEPITETEYNTLMSVGEKEFNELTKSPELYLEKKQGIKEVQGIFEPVMNTQPGLESEVLKENARVPMAKFIAKKLAITQMMDEYQKRFDNEGVVTKGINWLEGWVPGFSWWNNRNAMENAPTSSYLTGSNLFEQSGYFWNHGDAEQALGELRQAMEEVYAANPYDALSYLAAINNYSQNDALASDIVQSAGIATGTSASVAGRAFLRAAASPNRSIPGMLNAVGQPAQAAWRTLQTEIRLAAQFDSGAAYNSIDDVARSAPSFLNAPLFVDQGAASTHTTEFLDRLRNQVMAQSEAIGNMKNEALNITRIEPGTGAYNEMMTRNQLDFERQYPGLTNNILSIRPVRSAENAISNTDHLEYQLGPNSGVLFDTEASAQFFINYNRLVDGRIIPRGNGFYVSLFKTADETLPTVRNALAIDIANAPTPQSQANRILGWIRTKDELLPEQISRDMKVVGSGAPQFSGLIHSIISNNLDGVKVDRDSLHNLRTFIENERDYVAPNGDRGRHSANLSEFIHNWRAQFNRPPTEAESASYTTFRMINDADASMRMFATYGAKSRLGLERFTFPSTKKSNNGQPFIEGRIRGLEDIYRYDDSAGIVVLDHLGGVNRLEKRFMGPNQRANLEDLVNNRGYRVIQVSRFGERDLRNSMVIPQGKVHFVITRDFKSAPLSLEAFQTRPGWHVENASKFYVSQPDIVAHQAAGGNTTIHDYYGDRNLLGFETRAEAVQYNNNLMQAINMYRANNLNGLQAFLANNVHLPHSYQDFMNRVRTGLIRTDVDSFVRGRGKNIHQEHNLSTRYDNFRDPDRDPFDVLNEDVNMQFLLERDGQIDTVVNHGTANAPMLGLRAARQVDPFNTMTRAMTGLARRVYTEPLKIKVAERFVREFGEVLAGTAEENTRFPMRALVKGEFKVDVANRELLAAAKNYRRASLEFFHTKSDDIARVDDILSVVQTRMQQVLGRNRGQDLFESLEPSMTYLIRDPGAFFRKVAFLPRMGFFNIKQYWVQAAGVSHIAALEGWGRALNSMAAGNLMRPLHLRGNDNILDSAAQMSSNFGWRPEHFKEAYLGLQRTGFQNVSGEYSGIDDVLNDNVIHSRIGKAVDSSLYFFRSGERVNRLSAWSASYSRWREANPLGTFDDRAIAEVLDRADLLTNNMTSASNAGFNNDPWTTVPTQFWSYQSRLADLMLGGRISREDKAYMMLTYSALYGVPLGVAGTSLGVLWPMHEETRQQMIKNGYNMDDPAWDAFSNGIPQAAINWVSGGEYNPNIAETYGPNGLSWMKDLFGWSTSEKSGAEILAGPAGKTAYETYKVAQMLLHHGYLNSQPHLASLLGTSSEDDSYYPLKAEDFIPVIQLVSSGNNALKAYYAATTGEYLSKNGKDKIKNGDPNTWSAIGALVFGTQSQDISDFYNKINVKNQLKEAQAEMRTEAIKNLRKSHDPEISDTERLEYRKRAKVNFTLGKFTQKQWYGIIVESIGKNYDKITEIDRQLNSADSEHVQRYINNLKNGF